MWYRLAQLTENTKNFLRSLNVSEEMLSYISTMDSSQLPHAINAIKHNPSITIEELQNLQSKQQRQMALPDLWQKIIDSYPDAKFKHWLNREIRVALRSSQIPAAGMLMRIYHWYRYATNNIGEFQITSYNLARAAEQALQYESMMAGKGKGLFYTPLERDEEGTIVDERVVYRWNDGWTMQAVTNDNDLLTEGNLMNHCVGDYCEAVKAGDSQIFSLRDAKNSPQATIELDCSGNIEQKFGNSNSPLTEIANKKVSEWYDEYAEKYLVKYRDYNSAMGAVMEGRWLNRVTKTLRNNHDIVMVAVRRSPKNLLYAGLALQNDTDIVVAAIQLSGLALQYVSEELRNNPQVVIEAVKQNPFALHYAGVAARNDMQIVLMAINGNGEVFQYASEELRNNPDFVFKAVRLSAYALEYASKELRNNPQIVLEAIQNNPYALQYASKELKNNPQIVLSAVSRKGSLLQYVSEELRNNPEIVLEAIQNNPYALQYASKELKNNPQIVLSAVSRKGSLLQYVSEELRNNPEIVLAAVKQNGMSLQYASRVLQDKPEIVFEAMTNNFRALEFASPRLKQSPRFLDLYRSGGTWRDY